MIIPALQSWDRAIAVHATRWGLDVVAAVGD
jgi:hypothetical protein